MFNRPEFALVYLATLGLGATFVPLNVRLASAELRGIIEDAETRLIVTEASFGEVVASCGGLLSSDDAHGRWLDVDSRTITDAAVMTLPPLVTHPVEPTTPAIIVYTSGTTGHPKGAIITCGNIAAETQQLIIDCELGRDERHLVFLPLCFGGGVLSSITPALRAGATIILQREFRPRAALTALVESRATFMMAVPYIFQGLMELPEFADADLSHLRKGMVGGSPLDVEVIEAFQARGVGMLHVFGMTEGTAGANLALPIEDSVRKLGSMGRPTFNTDVRLVTSAGTEASPGEVGEMQFRGPQVFAGYWHNPAATAEAFTEDGWFKTGDLARRDDEGYYYTAGRLKDMIVSGGLNVYAAEVELVIRTHPSVADCAVVGEPDATWQEIVVAYVVPVGGATIDGEAIRAHCRTLIAGYKVPKKVYQCEDLPRTVSGKIQKFRLIPGSGATDPI